MRTALTSWGIASGIAGMSLLALGLFFSRGIEDHPAAPPAHPAPEPLVFSSPTPDPIPSASTPTWTRPLAPNLDQLRLPPMVRFPEADQALIDQAVNQALEQKLMPGCVVLIGSSEGVLFRRAYGARSVLPERTPMTEETLFDLASITKSVATTLSLMVLLDQGRVSLDDSVSDYLPELAAEENQKITLRQLLLHSSGLPAGSAIGDFTGGLEAAVRHIDQLPLVSPPGQKYLYSDLGFILLGAVVQRVTKQPLDAFARAHIFGPLGMTETGFRPSAKLRLRAAPTTQRGEHWLVGEVHDERAAALGGVAGHAGLFSTADDLSRLGRMMLLRGQVDQTPLLTPRTFRLMTTPVPVGTQMRTLGWDAPEGNSVMSNRALGHGGFTGTSFWVDPEHNLFVVFLSNRLHPSGTLTAVEPVARRIRQIATLAIPRIIPLGRRNPPVLLGIDVLRGEGFARVAGQRLALLTQEAARARDGKRTQEILTASGAPVLQIFRAEVDRSLTLDPQTLERPDYIRATPVGPPSDPFGTGLQGIDTLVVDLLELGWRGSHEVALLRGALRAAAHQKVRVLVLDRPNLLGGDLEGPRADTRAPVDTPAPANSPGKPPTLGLPWIHGLTSGELARWLNYEEGLGAHLDVVPLSGYERNDLAESTELPWFSPSPGMTEPNRLRLYPVLALAEAAGFSIGRGSPDAFEVVGAPGLDAADLLARFSARSLSGVIAEAIQFLPATHAHAGKSCAGLRFRLTDPLRFRQLETGLALLRELGAGAIESIPSAAGRLAFEELLDSKTTADALQRGDDLNLLALALHPSLVDYLESRKPALLY